MIAIVGDRNPRYSTHLATDAAFADLGVEIEWVPTTDLVDDASVLDRYGGCLIAPGSPYRSMDGALNAIRHAREHDLPLLGTCGGFQHVLVEFARNAAGIAGADHAEVHPGASEPVCVELACSLAGQRRPVHIEPGTLAHRLYGVATSVEPYFCRFGFNPDYRPRLEAHGVRFSGFDDDGEPRIVELPGHRFYLATLYVPQAGPAHERPHPLLTGFIEAAKGLSDLRSGLG